MAKVKRTTPPSSAKGWHRRGNTPGLFDNGDWTLSIGRDWRCEGSHRPFRIELFHRVYTPGAGAPKGDGTHYDGKRVKQYALRLPVVPFRWYFRLRRVPGAGWLYRTQQSLLWRLSEI